MTQIRYTIRKVTKKHREGLFDLCTQSFPEEQVEEIITPLLEKVEHFYIAEEEKEKKIIGFIAFGIYSIDTAHIMVIAVLPDYQRKGIGTTLINFALEIIRKMPVKTVRLEVRVSNQSAIDFYNKLGFKTIGRLENYYHDLSDAFLMILELQTH